MQNEDLTPVITVEDATGRLNDLTVARFTQFLWATPALRMICKLFDVAKDPFDQLRRRYWILQCDVVRYCVKIRQSGL